MMKCTICKKTIAPEHPDGGGRGLNPITFRWGWIHNWCLVNEIFNLRGERKKQYDDKLQSEDE